MPTQLRICPVCNKMGLKCLPRHLERFHKRKSAERKSLLKLAKYHQVKPPISSVPKVDDISSQLSTANTEVTNNLLNVSRSLYDTTDLSQHPIIIHDRLRREGEEMQYALLHFEKTLHWERSVLFADDFGSMSAEACQLNSSC